MKFITQKISDFTEQQYNKCISLMTRERRAYIDTVTNKERKIASVCAEWCLKKLSAEYTNTDIEKITLLRSEKGKPYLKDMPFYISISHSSDLIAVAISQTPIGIDIEKIKDRNFNLCQKICTPQENDFIESSDDKLLAFYKIWTAKEAYFKKIGTGIVDLKSISYENINCTHFFENDYIITIAK